MQEFVPLFNAAFIHFGGDEVENYTCWEQSTEVQMFALRMGFHNMSQVRNYLEARVQAIAANHSVTSIFWEEVGARHVAPHHQHAWLWQHRIRCYGLEAAMTVPRCLQVFDQGFDLQPSSIIDAYISTQELLAALEAGYRGINSFGLYLDQQQPYGDIHYLWQDTWTNFWLQDPLFGANVTADAAARLIGMSASLWGEQVDAANIHSRAWPRGCGAAERMWSDANLRDVDAAFPRIEDQRCRMLRRGIAAGPIRPADMFGWCSLPANSRFA